jgi:hypothetical protein
MSQLATGWEVVCADGGVRHLPYLNRGDAEVDGRVFSTRGCRAYPKPSALEQSQPPCPGGDHQVRPTVFVARAPEEGLA